MFSFLSLALALFFHCDPHIFWIRHLHCVAFRKFIERILLRFQCVFSKCVLVCLIKYANISTGHLREGRINTRQAISWLVWCASAQTYTHDVKSSTNAHRKTRRAYLVRKTESRKSSKDWNGTDTRQRFYFFLFSSIYALVVLWFFSALWCFVVVVCCCYRCDYNNMQITFDGF